MRVRSMMSMSMMALCVSCQSPTGSGGDDDQALARSPQEQAEPQAAEDPEEPGPRAEPGAARGGPGCVAEQCEDERERAEALAHDEQNVLGEPLATCGTDPMTGFYRDGTCRTGPRDRGVHVVCAEVTDAFLRYSKAQGNDLMSPSPRHGFTGLEDGDRWCLCAARWEEARRAGVAPPVALEATAAAALDPLKMEQLREHALKQDE